MLNWQIIILTWNWIYNQIYTQQQSNTIPYYGVRCRLNDDAAHVAMPHYAMPSEWRCCPWCNAALRDAVWMTMLPMSMQCRTTRCCLTDNAAHVAMPHYAKIHDLEAQRFHQLCYLKRRTNVRFQHNTRLHQNKPASIDCTVVLMYPPGTRL